MIFLGLHLHFHLFKQNVGVCSLTCCSPKPGLALARIFHALIVHFLLGVYREP